MTIEDYRKGFPFAQERLHFNHAGQSLLTQSAYDELMWCADLFRKEGAFSWIQLAPKIEKARRSLAQFLGAFENEVAYFPSTANAISQVAFGLSLKAGDEILIWDQEYPSSFYPWAFAARKAGAHLKVIPSESDLAAPAEKMLAAVTSRTRVIATSWVQFRNGAIVDLKALTDFARPRGIWTCADIIQGAGVLPFDFHESGLDAACGGSHKWLCSGHGAGYLLLREERLNQIEPLMYGAMSFGTPDDAVDIRRPLRAGAQRFEPGGKAFAEVLALGASCEFFQSIGGIHLISEEAQRLAHRLQSGLQELGYCIRSPQGQNFRGAIVTFAPGATSPYLSREAMEAALRTAGVSFVYRDVGIRLSPHAMMRETQVDRVLEVLSGK